MTNRMNRGRDRLEIQVFLILTLARISNWNRRHEGLRIGMLRVFEHAGPWTHFDNPAQIHHTDIVADAFHDGHIVADEQKGQTQFGLQFHHQIQNLRLHRHIQRRNGFVCDDQLGVQGQSARNRHPLTLPPGQFVRETPHETAGQFHPVKQHLDPLLDVCAFQRAKVMDRFGHLIRQDHLRIKRRKRILKDHLHIAPRVPQLIMI